MSNQAVLPPDRPGTVSLFSLTESLGVDVNALVNASQTAGKPEALAHLYDAEYAITRLREYTIAALLNSGMTWARIAHYLGTSPQNAHKKYRHLDELSGTFRAGSRR